MQKKVLVTGATGFQGNAVVRQLIADGFIVKCFVLSSDDTSHLESLNVEISTGSFDNLESLITSFRDVDKVVLSFPLIFEKEILMQFAHNVVNAWKKSNVTMFVFNTNLPVYHKEVGLAAFDIKLAIEQLFDLVKLPYISLRPTLYMDNLSAPFLLPVIKANGILPYPVPSGKKIAWMSHSDLAKFVSASLTRPNLIGQKFYLGGIQQISGEEMVTTISKYAQKPIHFIPLTPDEFEGQLSGGFGIETAREIANIYRFVKDNVEHLQAKDLRDVTLISLPVSLQTFDDWASQIDWS
jgi:NAD(P)H dehydrogenase (quinone)